MLVCGIQLLNHKSVSAAGSVEYVEPLFTGHSWSLPDPNHLPSVILVASLFVIPSTTTKYDLAPELGL